MNEFSAIIEKTLSGIHDIREPLIKVSSETEPMFINLGNELQDIFSDSENLTSLTRETAGLIDGDENNNILANIGDFSRNSVSRLDTCREDVTNILPKVETCTKNLKRLRDMCPVIRTIAKKLNIVALNISMESSRGKTREEMFTFFVKEIKVLAQKVQEISVKIREDSDTARSQQIYDLQNISERRNLLNDLADNARRKIADNVLNIEDLIKMALKVMKSAETHSKKISDLVGDIVIAIQFHDIVRQQIEHVIEILDEVPDFFTKENEPENLDEQTKASIFKTYSILFLQVEQINQVIKEINEAYKKIKRSLNDIGSEVESLVSGVTGLDINSGNSDSNQNPFSMLLSGLDQLNGIMGNSREIADLIEHNLKQSADTAAGLANHLAEMEDISMDLHIKAINALIMSKRLGSDGKTLSVLAEDVTEVSMDSNKFVLAVVDILKAIGGLSSSMSCLSSVSEDETDNGKDRISLTEGIGIISDVYAEFINKSEKSAESSRELKDKITGLESGLNFLHEMEEILKSQLIGINKLMEEIRPYIPEESDINDNLDHLRSRYTMEIERGVHNKVFNETQSDGDNIDFFNEGNEEQADNNEDYLGDNIELF